MWEENPDVNTTGSEPSNDDFAQPQIFHSRLGQVTYENPPSFKGWKGLPSALAAIKWKFGSEQHSGIPSDDELDKKLPVRFPDFTCKSVLQATWLGHATVLVQMDGVNFITDPVLSSRASPIIALGQDGTDLRHVELKTIQKFILQLLVIITMIILMQQQ